MAVYRFVYDSRHLQADCQEPGSAPEPYARKSSMGDLYLFLHYTHRWCRMTSPPVDMARTRCWRSAAAGSGPCGAALTTWSRGVQTASTWSADSRTAADASSCVTAASRPSVHDWTTSRPYADIVCSENTRGNH